ARACRDETARLFPELVEEIDAQAKAAGRSADDVLWHYCLNVGAPPARAAGTGSANCSSVGVMTAAGPVIARNYDFFYFETWRHLVTVQPRRGLAHTGMWPGLLGGRYDGVNAAGVWVSIHGGGPSARTFEHGASAALSGRNRGERPGCAASRVSRPAMSKPSGNAFPRALISRVRHGAAYYTPGGRSPTSTRRTTSRPSRTTVKMSTSPTSMPSMASRKSLLSLTARPLTSMTTSRTRRPARSAAVPGMTSRMMMPRSTARFSCRTQAWSTVS